LTAKAQKKAGPGVTFLLDFGPLLAFFLTYTLLDSLIVGTAVFMVAILIALVASLALLGRVSPMTWISAVLVIGFGGLTIYFNDPRFIQMKPTIIYSGFALLLFAGLAFGKPLLKHVFGMAFEGLSDAGWLKLTRNWAFFFAAMAALNEVLRAWLTFDSWLTVKVWGLTILSLLFAFANIPMLMRHGFAVDPKEEGPEIPPVPPQL
jgi:intracellular septation protein